MSALHLHGADSVRSVLECDTSCNSVEQFFVSFTSLWS